MLKIKLLKKIIDFLTPEFIDYKKELEDAELKLALNKKKLEIIKNL